MKPFLLALLFVTLPAGLFAQGLGQAAEREREKREKRSGQKATPSYTDEDLKKEDPNAKKKEGKEGKEGKETREAKEAQQPSNPLIIPLPSAEEVGPGREAEAIAARGGPRAPVVRRAYEETGNETPEELRAAKARANLPPSENGESSANDDADALARAALKDRASQAQTSLKEAQDTLTPAQERIDQIRRELSPMSPGFNQDPNRQLQLQADLNEAERQLDAARKQLDAAQQGWQDVLEAARRAGVSANELTPR